jgi:hypothetical protein
MICSQGLSLPTNRDRFSRKAAVSNFLVDIVNELVRGVSSHDRKCPTAASFVERLLRKNNKVQGT